MLVFSRLSTPQSYCLKSAICQCSAEHPVAALTAHRAVIHYRDCASLTPQRGANRRGQAPALQWVLR